MTAPFPAGKVAVDSPDVDHLTLVTPLPLAARVYVGPWLVLYPLAAYAFYIEYDTYIKSIGTRSLGINQSDSTTPHGEPRWLTRWRSWRVGLCVLQNGRSCCPSACSEVTHSRSSSRAGPSASEAGERLVMSVTPSRDAHASRRRSVD